jgi:hypothetical protein
MIGISVPSALVKLQFRRWPCVLAGLAVLCLFAVNPVSAQASRARKLPPLKFPSWYQTLPKDKDNLLARGMEQGADMQLSIDKAAAVARMALGAQLEAQWLGTLSQARTELPGLRDPQYNKDEAKLTGSSIRFQKAVKRGKLYTAFVLVAWPKSSVREALQARAREDGAWLESAKDSKTVQALMK